MIDKKNGSLTTRRRKFLTMLVGSAIGFSIPYTKNINSVRAQRYAVNVIAAGAPFMIAAGVKFIADYFYWNQNKQGKSKTGFRFRFKNTNSRRVNISFTTYIEKKDGTIIRETPHSVKINKSNKWKEYWWEWTGKGYSPPLYLRIKSGNNEVTKRFY